MPAFPALSERSRLTRSVFVFSALLAIAWLACNFVWTSFPYIRNGTRCIIDAKVNRIDQGPLFDAETDDRFRVLVFGDSRALCGFKPNAYKEMSGGRVESFNLGMPGEKDFVEYFDRAIAAGNRPTHVFLLIPWKSKPDLTADERVWKWFDSDRRIADTLIPFRSMPRDLISFALNSRRNGGPSAFYESTRQTCEEMLQNKGYHFIKSAANYANDELPENFKMWSDEPEKPWSWKVDASGPVFERIRSLAKEYRFKVCFVPSFRRVGSCKEAMPINQQMIDELKPFPEFSVHGPDYFLYPNKYFSDALHLNRAGADAYMLDFWRETKGIFDEEKSTDEANVHKGSE